MKEANRVVVAPSVVIPEVLQHQFEKAKTALETHEYSRGFHIEKLNKFQLFSLRLTQKDRVLLTFVRKGGKIEWHIVELCENHQYSKAIFVKNPTLIRDYINEHSDYEVIEITQTETPLKDCQVNELTIYANQLISLSNQQGEAVNTTPPAIFIGVAGSGKTCIAMEWLKKFYAMMQDDPGPHKEILYVTKSPYLVKSLQLVWDSLPEASEEVRFVTTDGLFRECYPDKEIVGDESLLAFLIIRNKKTKFNFSNDRLEFIKHEMKIISVVESLEEYLNFGDRHSLIKDVNEKKWIYEALQEYINHLDAENKVNPDFNSLNFDTKAYALVCDEAQDLSLKTKLELLRITESGRVCFNVDSNQNIHNAISDLDKFVAILGRQIKPILLEGSYRCPQKVVAVARCLSEIRDALLGGRYDKNTYQITAEINVVGQYRWVRSTRNLAKDGELSFDAQTVVICQEALHKQAEENFPGAICLTYKEAKGLQFKNVILFEPFTPELLRALRTIELNYTGETKVRGRRDKSDIGGNNDKFAPVLNEIYTAITRAEIDLTIFQSRRDQITRKIEQIFNDAAARYTQDEIVSPHDEMAQSTSDACSSSESIQRARSERLQGYLLQIERLEHHMQHEAANRIRRNIGLAEVVYAHNSPDLAPKNSSRRKKIAKCRETNKDQVLTISDDNVAEYLLNMENLLDNYPDMFLQQFNILLELPDFYKCCLGLSLAQTTITPLIKHIVTSERLKGEDKELVFKKIVEKITKLTSISDLFKILRYLGIRDHGTQDFVNYLFENKIFDEYLGNLLPRFTPKDFSIFMYLLPEVDIKDVVENFLLKNVSKITVSQFITQVELYHDTLKHAVSKLSFFNFLSYNADFATLLRKVIFSNTRLLEAARKLLNNTSTIETFTFVTNSEHIACQLYQLAIHHPICLKEMLNKSSDALPLEYLFMDDGGKIQDKNSNKTLIAHILQHGTNALVLLLKQWIILNYGKTKRVKFKELFSLELHQDIDEQRIYYPFINLFVNTEPAAVAFLELLQKFPYLAQSISFKNFHTPYFENTTTGEKSVSYFLKLLASLNGVAIASSLVNANSNICDEIDFDWLYEVNNYEKYFLGMHATGLDCLCLVGSKLFAKLYRLNYPKIDKARFASMLTRWHGSETSGMLANFSPFLALCIPGSERRELLKEIILKNTKIAEYLTSELLNRKWDQGGGDVFSCLMLLSKDESGREILKLLKTQNPKLDISLEEETQYGYKHEAPKQKEEILEEIKRIMENPRRNSKKLDELILSSTLTIETLFRYTLEPYVVVSSDQIRQLGSCSLFQNLNHDNRFKDSKEMLNRRMLSGLIRQEDVTYIENTFHYIAHKDSGKEGRDFIFWFFKKQDGRLFLSNMLPKFSTSFFYLLVLFLQENNEKNESIKSFIKENAHKITPTQFYEIFDLPSYTNSFFRFLAYRDGYEDLLDFIFQNNTSILRCLADKREQTYLTKSLKYSQVSSGSDMFFSELARLICLKLEFFVKMIDYCPDILLSIKTADLFGYPHELNMMSTRNTPITQLVLLNPKVGIPLIRKWVIVNYKKKLIGLDDLRQFFSFLSVGLAADKTPLLYGFASTYETLADLYSILDSIKDAIDLIDIRSLNNPMRKGGYSYLAQLLTSECGISMILSLCKRKPSIIEQIDENCLYQCLENKRSYNGAKVYRTVIAGLFTTENGIQLFRLLFSHLDKERFFDFLTSLPKEQPLIEDINYSLFFTLCINSVAVARSLLFELVMSYPSVSARVTPELLLKSYKVYIPNSTDGVDTQEQNIIATLSSDYVGEAILDKLSLQDSLVPCIESYRCQEGICKAKRITTVRIAEMSAEKYIYKLLLKSSFSGCPDMSAIKYYIDKDDQTALRRTALQYFVVDMFDDNKKLHNLLVMQALSINVNGAANYSALYKAWPGIVSKRFVELLFSVEVGVSVCHRLLIRKGGMELLIDMLTTSKNMFAEVLTAEMLCQRPPVDFEMGSEFGFFNKTTPKFCASLYEILLNNKCVQLLQKFDEAVPKIVERADDINHRRANDYVAANASISL